METKEKQKNINQIKKPLYKKEAFIVSVIVFVLFLFIGVIQSFNKTTSIDESKIINQSNQISTSTTTTEKIDFDALLKDLQNKSSSTKTLPIQNITQEKSTADVVAEWQDRVARVECVFAENTGPVISQGSATLANLKYKDNSIVMTAITNRHVLLNNNHHPEGCVIGIYGKGSRQIKYINSAFQVGFNEDFGGILLNEATILETKWESVVYKPMKSCSESNVKLGDDLLILGYPTIGTVEGLTVTKGIISGIEKDYFVTDAKIDHGNSGGTAILLKDNCYLGIPSSSVTGEIESMGRILKASFVIN
jgi:hypothetical protein